MCGWCVEQFALEVLEKSGGRRFPFRECGDAMGRFFFLREVSDFPQGLAKVARSARRKGLDLQNDLPREPILLSTLENLRCAGFTASSYQQLIRRKLVRRVIMTSCGDGISQQYLEAVKGVGEELAFLYRPDTYLSEKDAGKLGDPTLLPACRRLLRHYLEWWLEGKSLKKNDLVERLKRTGVLDPIGDIAEDEWQRFYLLLRAVYFSLLSVSRFPAEAPLLKSIAERPPAGVPDFDGWDLWMQRRAALFWYDLNGFEGLITEKPRFRSTLLYYIHLKRTFTAEQMDELLFLAREDPFTDSEDCFLTMEDWIRK